MQAKMTDGIPADAFDDRLGFTGTSGSGKSYTSMQALERLLSSGARAITVDPMDVYWGLRVLENGKTPSPYNIVIFGGAHADVQINERSGAIIGETVATMAESCIISLGEFETAASQRRFMLAFLTALYKAANKEPVHLIFDEADMWAPQIILDREGGATNLLGKMEAFVRRGRIRGFIPWLITQRPASISKNVLSQMDGLIAMKLTSSQDRKAIGAWVEGQADKDDWKRTYDAMPTLQQGQGIMWLPSHGILETVQFPQKKTFDSSAGPKRGQLKRTAELQPVDISALKDRLATVEQEIKSNDPKSLKARITELEKALSTQAKGAIDPEQLLAAENRGHDRGYKEGHEVGIREGRLNGFAEASRIYKRVEDSFSQAQDLCQEQIDLLQKKLAATSENKPATATLRKPQPQQSPVTDTAPKGRLQQAQEAIHRQQNLKASHQRVLDAIAWWRKIGVEPVKRDRASIAAGYSPKASTFGVYLSELIKLELIESSRDGLRLTDRGLELAVTPEATTAADLYEMARSVLKGRAAEVFELVYRAWPDEISRDEIAERMDLSPQASTTGVYISQVSKMGIIVNGRAKHMRAADWLFP